MKIQINCSSPIASFFFLVLIFSSPLFFYDGLAAPDNKTDPIEVDALNAIFRNWNIPFTGSRTYVGVNSSTGGIIIRTVDWNISSTSPCTRFVVDNSEDERISITFHRKPDILCLCSQQTSLCNIIKLSLWGFNVTGMIPNALQNLTKLQILYLSKNNFNGSLPPQIGNLKNIQILGLSNNKLGGNLPMSLWNLTNLESL
ncbi:hypothetical protein ZOSMA_2G00030 [Zostera marina]|uniref:Non-specific serine/threonine protein kinase n=1 Tax=Zostera marina TaxID=29655 RepID=A0A0K9PAI5_ZOSMR|nr:hypothetical protein ZOSMA_2G00030 [Zostera marina]